MIACELEAVTSILFTTVGLNDEVPVSDLTLAFVAPSWSILPSTEIVPEVPAVPRTVKNTSSSQYLLVFSKVKTVVFTATVPTEIFIVTWFVPDVGVVSTPRCWM